MLTVLREAGYEPHQDGSVVLLRNCPSDALVTNHRDLTCATDFARLDGIRPGIGEAERSPRPVTIQGTCCVAYGPGLPGYL